MSTINETKPEDTIALNTPGFKPFTLEIDCMSEGFAIRLWATLSVGEGFQRQEIEKYAGAAALAKFDDHAAPGLSEGLYPIWNTLDDMLVAQGVINKG